MIRINEFDILAIQQMYKSQKIRYCESVNHILFVRLHRILCTSVALILIASLELLLTGADADPQPKYLIGVQPERRNLYEPVDSQKQIFKCLDGSGSIPLDFVNDDYCDCRDASDEPGTSACPHGRFFCLNEGFINKVIPSAWVNDGHCDCCDASDEHNSTITCQNTCDALGEIYRREQEKNREIADQGSALRSQYKEQARQRREQNGQLLDQYKRELSEKETAIKQLEEELNSDFGPSNVYLPLKGKCFSFNDREYTYTLWPFERATQESTSGMQTELGRWAGWAGQGDSLYSRQKYEGGMQCWNGPARSALINIECGVEDKVTAVTEPAKCEYVYNFITPAACPDTDPQEPTNQETNENQQEETITVNPLENAPSLEVEDDSLDPETSNYFPDDQNEAPDGEKPLTSDEKHDEL